MVVVGGSNRAFVHHESNVWNFIWGFGNGEIEKGTFSEWNEIVALGRFVFGRNFRRQNSSKFWKVEFFEILDDNILRNFGWQ